MRIKSLFLFVFMAGLSASASATQPMPPPQVDVEIVADDGRVFARYDLADRSQRGKLRAYLEAEKGRNYGIRVHNRSGGRIGLVIAVDGRNIISGEKSYLRGSEPMYVLGAYGQATYEGWRTSDTRVHRFFFTDVQSSYAEAWGDRSAMGVIAVAAFQEVPQVQPRRDSGRRQMAPEAAAPGESRAGKSSESADASSAPGTGFGDGRYSRSVRVHFKPQRHAFTTHFLKYEWRETLVDLGIIRDTPPNRFWPEQLGQAQTREFAPHPPGYWSRRR
jgi:hypothetical protein